MGLQDVIRFFLPREDHFYAFLERQALAAADGARALATFSEGTSAAEVREAVQTVEHEGDRIVHEMEEALAKTFVTPIDREDLHRLSSELDGVLDRINGSIRACDMLGVEEPTPPMKELITIIGRCTAKLGEAIPKLRKHQYTSIVADARELRKLEKEGDAVYRQAISALFREGASARGASLDARVLIREQTVLEDLENAIDHCDSIADMLANLAVKHG